MTCRVLQREHTARSDQEMQVHKYAQNAKMQNCIEHRQRHDLVMFFLQHRLSICGEVGDAPLVPSKLVGILYRDC